MNNTLVVGAAPVPGADAFYSRLLAGAARVVAADAAGEWCVAFGRVPDVVVGDFDSAAPEAAHRLSAAGARIVSHPQDKDETDLDLAVQVALGLSADPVVLTCAFSRRVDHTLAAFGALVRAGAGARVSEPAWSAWACVAGRELEFAAEAGATVSVLAVGEARGVRIEGTRWTLEDAALSELSGRGVSNRAVGGPVRVRVGSGALIVVLLNTEDGGLY